MSVSGKLVRTFETKIKVVKNRDFFLTNKTNIVKMVVRGIKIVKSRDFSSKIKSFRTYRYVYGTTMVYRTCLLSMNSSILPR